MQLFQVFSSKENQNHQDPKCWLYAAPQRRRVLRE